MIRLMDGWTAQPRRTHARTDGCQNGEVEYLPGDGLGPQEVPRPLDEAGGEGGERGGEGVRSGRCVCVCVCVHPPTRHAHTHPKTTKQPQQPPPPTTTHPTRTHPQGTHKAPTHTHTYIQTPKTPTQTQEGRKEGRKGEKAQPPHPNSNLRRKEETQPSPRTYPTRARSTTTVRAPKRVTKKTMVEERRVYMASLYVSFCSRKIWGGGGGNGESGVWGIV